jgi:hypothetical protein
MAPQFLYSETKDIEFNSRFADQAAERAPTLESLKICFSLFGIIVCKWRPELDPLRTLMSDNVNVYLKHN